MSITEKVELIAYLMSFQGPESGPIADHHITRDPLVEHSEYPNRAVSDCSIFNYQLHMHLTIHYPVDASTLVYN